MESEELEIKSKQASKRDRTSAITFRKHLKNWPKTNLYCKFSESPDFPIVTKSRGQCNGTFLQQLECGYRFPALIHVWIASAGVLELFISTSGEATSACKPFWHNGWGNSGMNECRKSIPTQELLQENHSLMFWQFGKFHISTSAQKLSCYIFLYPTLIWQVFIC